MRSGYAIAAIVFLSVSALAQTIDKSKMRDVIRRDCPTVSLNNKQLIDVLLLGGGDLPTFCECLSTRFTAHLDDADYGNEDALGKKYRASQIFCLGMSTK
jgi:hypothetical protein